MFLLVALGLNLSARAMATSVTVQITSGTAYALDVRSLQTPGSATSQPCVAFSGFAYVLRQFDSRCQWDWDARTGLLRLAVGGQRFSFSSERAVVAVNNNLVQVASPIRFVESEIWLPLESLRLAVRSLEGLKMIEPDAHVLAGTVPTSLSIVQSPEQALRKGLLPGPSGRAIGEGSISTPTLEGSPVWKVVFDPVLVETEGTRETDASELRPALAQIAERCANILTEEASMQPFVLTEHDAATSPDTVLEWVSRRSPDLIVFLRWEISPMRTASGYSIFYTEEAVDWFGFERLSETFTSATVVPRDRSYLPFQVGSRRLAEQIGSALAEVAGFRDRLILPAPFYLLKRCPARSVMIAFGFPERSSDLSQLADSGFREDLVRALAGALIAFRRSNAAPAGEPGSRETREP